MLREYITAVWPKPCSTRMAVAIASVASGHAHQRQHRHQQLELHERVLLVDLGDQQAQLVAGVDADLARR